MPNSEWLRPDPRSSAFIRGSILFCASMLLVCGCASHRPSAPASLDQAMKLLDNRPDWRTLPALQVPRYPGEKFLKGLTICLDPGHGGTEGGETTTRPASQKAGFVPLKESVINLRVALFLERLLKDAGVNVIMTRHDDETISLHDRAEIANNATRPDGKTGADLFISIHHNASKPNSNYPSVWYHGGIDNNEPDIDVARHIAFELGQQMHTDVGITSPIFSSQLMYDTGFGVLRQTKMPAVLCECSFMTHPPEEQRLRDPDYNLREAYAIYLGLCEWAYCGRPTQTPPVTVSSNGQTILTTTLREGLPNWWGSDRNRIFASSVEVTLDGTRLPIQFDELTRKLTATLPTDLDPQAEHVIQVHHENMLGNHNWPQRYRLGAPGHPATPLPAKRPNQPGPHRQK